MCWIVVGAKDSENIDFPVETAWTIATKKNVGTDQRQYSIPLLYLYVLKNNMLNMSDLLDKSMSCLRLQMLCNLQVHVIAKYYLIVTHFLFLTFIEI